jgi:hypothetical protein
MSGSGHRGASRGSEAAASRADDRAAVPDRLSNWQSSTARTPRCSGGSRSARRRRSDRSRQGLSIRQPPVGVEVIAGNQAHARRGATDAASSSGRRRALTPGPAAVKWDHPAGPKGWSSAGSTRCPTQTAGACRLAFREVSVVDPLSGDSQVFEGRLPPAGCLPCTQDTSR